MDGRSRRDDLIELDRVCLPKDPRIDPSVGYWWLALDGRSTPVGYAGLLKLGSGGSGYLCRAGVLPEHRGSGLHQRLIRARVAKGRRLGMTYLVTDTRAGNIWSSNNLIEAGFRLYAPDAPWSFTDACYWILRLR